MSTVWERVGGAWLCLGLLASGCSTSGDGGSQSVHGDAIFRQPAASPARPALAPPDARVALAPQPNQAAAVLNASDAATGDGFGSAVSFQSGSALVGAPRDDDGGYSAGAAYVFARAADAWAQDGKLLASDSAEGAYFGRSLGLSAATAIIGAQYANSAAGNGSGAAYLFERAAGFWSEKAKLLGNDSEARDGFGAAVAIANDIALVGSPGDDDAGTSSGSAYVMVRTASAWTQEAKLVANDAAGGASFGSAVAVSGNRAVVGASKEGTVGVVPGNGAAYVFIRNAGNWTQDAKLFASDGAPDEAFGSAVSLDGDRAIIGAFAHEGVALRSGAAYLFVREGGGWQEQAKLVPEDAAEDDQFGGAVSLRNAVAMVGAPGKHHSGASAGAAYVFREGVGGWQQEAELGARAVTGGDRFGSAVSIDGTTALVGATGDELTMVDSGLAYVFGLAAPAAACNSDTQCSRGHCADGVCCDNACDGSCTRCNLTASLGQCTALTASHDAPWCAPYRCQQAAGSCAASCGIDGDCTENHYCRDAVCIPKEPLGDGCSDSRECHSGHCVHGVCCEGACEGGCLRCDEPSAAGHCLLLDQTSHDDSPCAPYVCDGIAIVCPEACSSNADCVDGRHCDEAVCAPPRKQGQLCQSATMCQSGHCLNERCCEEADCGSYRCDSTGRCAERCDDDDACSNGFLCDNRGTCARAPTEPASVHSDGGCSIRRLPFAPGSHWPASLLMALIWRRSRHSRRVGKARKRLAALRQAAFTATLLIVAGCGAKREPNATETAPAIVAQHLATSKKERALLPMTGGPSMLTVNESATKLVAGDILSDAYLGTSVSVSDQLALMAAPEDRGYDEPSGSAFVFARNANTWTEEAKLMPAQQTWDQQFGLAVAVGNDVALVGMIDGGVDPGAVHVFNRNAGSWREQGKLVPSDASHRDLFGYAISLSGNLALIGAPDAHAGAILNSGAAYVFQRNADSWTEQAKLMASDAVSDDQLGSALSISGSVALVGAPGKELGGTGAYGAAYVFERSASAWLQRSRLTSPAAAGLAHFGTAVSISGSSALVGSPGQDDGGLASVGAAYLFERDASGWPLATRLMASDKARNNWFASALAIRGDIAILGATGASRTGVGPGVGKAYFFQRSASSWSETAIWRAEDGVQYDLFGDALSLANNVALVAAPYSGESPWDAGAGYIFGTTARGATCTSPSDCGTGHCAQGVCCESACDSGCERCDAAASLGICILREATSEAPACTPYRCDGRNVTCPIHCDGDIDCSDGYRCENASCVARAALSAPCQADRECLSGHCSQNVCCDRSCEGGCERCDGAQAPGRCLSLPPGAEGAAYCRPYLCDGKSTTCPTQCGEHAGCLAGYHCDGGTCKVDIAAGELCADDASCETELCTDERCCLVRDCSPYRCADAGACALGCTSSAHCAPGFQCSSSGRCIATQEPRTDAEEAGGCALEAGPPGHRYPSYALGLLLLGFLFRRDEARPVRPETAGIPQGDDSPPGETK